MTALTRAGDGLSHLLLLIIRLYWGSSLVMTGIGKLSHLDKVAGFFASLHLPFPTATAIVVALVELTGGAALFLGLFSRFMSLLLMILFWVAYLTAHIDALMSIFSNPSLFLMQDAFLYLFVATIVFCFGPGIFAIDYWLNRK